MNDTGIIFVKAELPAGREICEGNRVLRGHVGGSNGDVT